MFASSSAAACKALSLSSGYGNPETSGYFSFFSVCFTEGTQGPFKDHLVKLQHTQRTHKTVPLQA